MVFERVGIKYTIVGALFGKVGKLTPDEKWEFLKRVCISKRVLDDLEGYMLSFNEIAFINSLLTTDKPEEIEPIFSQAVVLISNEEIKEEVLLLKERYKMSSIVRYTNKKILEQELLIVKLQKEKRTIQAGLIKILDNISG